MFQSLRFISLGLIGAAIAAFGQSAMPTAQMPVSTTVQLLELKLLVDPTMPLYSRYTVERPDVPETSPLFKSLGWEVLLNGRSERSASARSSTQERLSTTRTGKYTVFLSAAGQDQYERVSNIIEVVVDLEAKGKPAIPAGAIVTKTKAGATSTYAVLDAKDLLKLELKKTGNQYLVRRPQIPAAWKNVSWATYIDGVETSQEGVDLNDPTFTPYVTKKGTYEILLRAVVDGRNRDVSERVKFRVAR